MASVGSLISAPSNDLLGTGKPTGLNNMKKRLSNAMNNKVSFQGEL